jgi:murein DD-endopeptidase MepM/ murein hydrolase activator NlpD
MPQQPIPVVEVFIHDEATSAVDRIRQKFRSAEMRALFKNTQAAFKQLEESAHYLERELGTLVRLSGAGAFLGGGLVVGINNLAQALGNLARASIQNRYLASSLGITVEQFDRLTARGRALGMTTEQARSSIEGVVGALRDLQTEGRRSHIFQELAKGRGGSGVRLARELMDAVNGPGGMDAGLRLLAYRMQGMNAEAQRHLSQLFGLGSVGFRDLFNYKESELRQVVQLSEPAARRYALALANLNISWSNVKTTIAGAVMPGFERLVTTFDRFLQGPGAKIVQQFADWLAALKVDWGGLAQFFVKGLNWLKDAFIAVKAAFDTVDPIVQKMGGWIPIIGGLTAVVGIAGFGGSLRGIAAGLAMIGRFSWLIPIVGGLALVAASVSSAGAAESRLGGGRGTIESPEVEVRPQGYRGGNGVGGSIPRLMRASFTTDGGPAGGAPYEVEEKATDTLELRRWVKDTHQQVQRLADYISVAALTTDATGAGGLAGFAGAIKVPGGVPGGGGGVLGGGGGGPSGRAPRAPGVGRRPRPGAGDDGGRVVDDKTAGTATLDGNEYLQKLRASRMAEINNNPTLKQRVLGMLEKESGFGNKHQTAATLEALVNRSIMLGNTIEQELGSGFYSGAGQHMRRGANLSPAQRQAAANALVTVQGGSNIILMRTDQGMVGDPNSRGPGRVPVPGTREVYNYFRGRGFSHADSARFAAQHNAQAQASKTIPTTATPVTPPATTPTAEPTTATKPVAPQVRQQPGAWAAPTTGTTGGQLGDIRRPYAGSPRAHLHQGVDIAAAHGTPVVSQMAGTVTRVWTSGSAAGNAVEVQYANGYTVRYYHLAGFGKFKAGQAVNAGDVVGFVGGTGPGGREMYSSHLHYEVRDASGRVVNPNDVLGIPGKTRGVQLVAGQPTGVNPEELKRKQIEVTRDAEERARKAEQRAKEYQADAKAKEAAATPDLIEPPKRSRLPVSITVRGPRGVKVDATGDGSVETTVAREMAPAEE